LTAGRSAWTGTLKIKSKIRISLNGGGGLIEVTPLSTLSRFLFICVYQVLVLVMFPFPQPLLQGDHLDQRDQFPSTGVQSLWVQLPVSK
jgi:hypothetical protein